jgi:hypothetical protein
VNRPSGRRVTPDGEANDGDPEPLATALRGLSSMDGNVVLYNCHLSSLAVSPIQFPDDEHGLPDNYARQLFRMTSVMPPAFSEAARREGFTVGELARGYVFNADLTSLVKFLEIGTRVDARNLR